MVNKKAKEYRLHLMGNLDFLHGQTYVISLSNMLYQYPVTTDKEVGIYSNMLRRLAAGSL
jgi:hypothetical protein